MKYAIKKMMDNFFFKNTGCTIFLLCFTTLANSQALSLNNYAFEDNFLKRDHVSTVDISRFSKPNSILPGTYDFQILINGKFYKTDNITFSDKEPNEYCLTSLQILNLGLSFKNIPDGERIEKEINATTGCIDIEKFLPDISIGVNPSLMSINFTIPQAYILSNPRGFVSPALWEEGATAAFLAYYANFNRNTSAASKSYSSGYVGIKVGANFGPWRFRHSGSLSKSDGRAAAYSSLDNYLERDLISLRSKLILGDYFTNSDVIDSIPFTGVQFRTDEQMDPQSTTGFAPTVRGVAETNAVVSIFQNGYEIYQQQVPPGPFEISDLYASGYQGDLEVQVKEADGRIQRFIVPFSNITQLLRPGVSKYGVSAGRLRDNSKILKYLPYFVQGSYQYGVSNLMTVYGGAVLGDKYLGASLGAAFNTRIGAIAFDATHSSASGLSQYWLDNAKTNNGQSYRLTLNKNFTESGTNLVLAAYRYSSKGFLNFQDYARFSAENSGYFASKQSFLGQRSRFQVYLNQNLWDKANIYLSGMQSRYWGDNQRKDESYQLGYSQGFDWGTMNLSYSRNRFGANSKDNKAVLSFYIPLIEKDTSISVQATSSDNYGETFTVGVNGSFDKNLNYYLNADYQSDADRSGASGSIAYNGSAVGFGASVYMDNARSRQVSVNATGALVVHSGGLNLARNIGETFAIIHAPGASGAKINGQDNNVIASNGYGVAPFLMPYRSNSIWLDSENVPSDVEIVDQGRYLVPTSGAVMAMKFKTELGQVTLLKISLPGSQTPPLGAEIISSNGAPLSVVGQDGYAIMRGLDKEQLLKVVWGQSDAEQCFVKYSPLDIKEFTKSKSEYLEHSVTCNLM